MLGRSDSSIPDAIQAFADFGVEACYFVPTETGFEKSIIDAHQSIRSYLKLHGIHDFELQGLGNAENGVKVSIDLVGIETFEQKYLSLYRPKTKTGDPRMWVNMKGYARPLNLMALIATPDKRLFLVNCSRPEILETRNIQGSPLHQVLTSGSVNPNSQKLLELLKDIAKRDWIDATKSGDTGVGHTLETLLGIDANSSKRPDFMDQIELKSGRRPSSGRATNRSTMLSKVPNWRESAMSAKEILSTFGAVSAKTGRQELYVTLNEKPNRQGLYLEYLESKEVIANFAKLDEKVHEVVQWDLLSLQADLRDKHKETFWVQAESRRTFDGNEQFKFVKVTRTRSPLVGNIGPLINTGVITMDYTLSEKDNGRVRDHGYLFKIWPKDYSLLFPAVEVFDLI